MSLSNRSRFLSDDLVIADLLEEFGLGDLTPSDTYIPAEDEEPYDLDEVRAYDSEQQADEALNINPSNTDQHTTNTSQEDTTMNTTTATTSPLSDWLAVHNEHTDCTTQHKSAATVEKCMTKHGFIFSLEEFALALARITGGNIVLESSIPTEIEVPTTRAYIAYIKGIQPHGDTRRIFNTGKGFWREVPADCASMKEFILDLLDGTNYYNLGALVHFQGELVWYNRFEDAIPGEKRVVRTLTDPKAFTRLPYAPIVRKIG